MRNQIYTKNTEYIACSQNLSKNLHFRKTFVYLSVISNTYLKVYNCFKMPINRDLFIRPSLK